MPALSDDVRSILAASFLIRATMTRRSDGKPRTVETTYVWEGSDQLYLSGYPGKRDWVASMTANAHVMVHTVERPVGGQWYDIPAVARILRDRTERLPHLLAFIERWSQRPGYPRWQFGAALALIRLNRRLHLPWWGPFYFIRKLFDEMPCVELRFAGQPVVRPGGPPPCTEPQPGRG